MRAMMSRRHVDVVGDRDAVFARTRKPTIRACATFRLGIQDRQDHRFAQAAERRLHDHRLVRRRRVSPGERPGQASQALRAAAWRYQEELPDRLEVPIPDRRAVLTYL